MNTELAVVYRHTDALRPYERNPRTHDATQVAQIAASIERFGWTNPVLIDEHDRVIAGHGRLAAAKVLGHATVPTICIGGLSDAARRALVIADNKLALNAGWDEALLASELTTLRADDFDLGVIGFTPQELDALRPVTDDGDDEPGAADVIPELGKVVVSSPGDVWVLGRHRIMCGDCRNPDHVARLIGQYEVNLAFTSPPYAEQREYDASSGFRPIPPDEYVDWFAPVAANVSKHLASDGSWFVNIKPGADGLDTFLYVFDLVVAHVRQWGWRFATEFCWERPGMPQRVVHRFKNQFEPIYQFARAHWKIRPEQVRVPTSAAVVPLGKGSGPSYSGDRQGAMGYEWFNGRHVEGLAYPGNRLPTFAGTHQALGHSAAFPVGLPEFFINAYTDKSDAVYDPFSGSGSTVMAAERTDRHGFGMELSPGYVDVSVRRWQTYTGKLATHEESGLTFDELAAQRAANVSVAA